jgi:hypothetical protein
MSRELQEGKGVLFSNNKKGNERAPDFKGDIMVDGKVIKLSGWKRTSAYGELISLLHNTYEPIQNKNTYPKEVRNDDGDVPF